MSLAHLVAWHFSWSFKKNKSQKLLHKRLFSSFNNFKVKTLNQIQQQRNLNISLHTSLKNHLKYLLRVGAQRKTNIPRTVRNTFQ